MVLAKALHNGFAPGRRGWKSSLPQVMGHRWIVRTDQNHEGMLFGPGRSQSDPLGLFLIVLRSALQARELFVRTQAYLSINRQDNGQLPAELSC